MYTQTVSLCSVVVYIPTLTMIQYHLIWRIITHIFVIVLSITIVSVSAAWVRVTTTTTVMPVCCTWIIKLILHILDIQGINKTLVLRDYLQNWNLYCNPKYKEIKHKHKTRPFLSPNPRFNLARNMKIWFLLLALAATSKSQNG